MSAEYEGTRWVTKDGTRTILIDSEVSRWRGDRMFLVRTVANKHTQSGRLGGSRQLSLPGLLRKYRRESES